MTYFSLIDLFNKEGNFWGRLGILRFGVIPKKLGHSKCGIWIADSGIFNLLPARPSRSVEGGRGL
jgi:hypothetical protein